MSEVDELNQTYESEFSQQEEKSLDTFFKSLGRALTAAQMYFRDHPSFDLAINDLKDKLGELAFYRESYFEAMITQESLLIDGKYFKSDVERYRELARQFHKRKIKSFRIDFGCTIEDLKEFIYMFSRLDEFLGEGKDLKEVFSELDGILIEELDYSHLLSLKGDHPKDIWDLILSPDLFDSNLSDESAEYIIDHVEEIVADVTSLPQDERLASKLLDNFNKLGKHVEQSSNERKKVFSQTLNSYLLSLDEDVQEKYLKSKSYSELKKTISSNIDKDTLLGGIVNQISTTRKINPLLLNLYNSAMNEESSAENIADDLSIFLRDNGTSEEKSAVTSVLQELFLEDDSDQFVSRFYNNTLSFMSNQRVVEAKSISDKYLKLIGEDELQVDYLYTLLELLYTANTVALVESIIGKIQVELPFFVERKIVCPLYDMMRAFSAKQHQSKHDRLGVVLDLAMDRLGFKHIFQEIIVKNISELDMTEASDMFPLCIENPTKIFVTQFFIERDAEIHKKLKTILSSCKAEELVVSIAEYLQDKRKDSMTLKQAIELLAITRTKEAAELLEEIYEENKKNVFMVTEICRALKQNPHKRAELFSEFLLDRNFNLRKEVIALYFNGASEDKRNALVKSLVSVDNFLGSNDDFITENVEILSELKAFELVPYLENLVKTVPWFFKLKRDKLRIVAIKVLSVLAPEKLELLSDLINKDSNPEILNIMRITGKNG